MLALMCPQAHIIAEGNIISVSDIICPTGQTSLKKAIAFAIAFFLAGEQRLELWTRGFGATVGKTLGNIYHPIFRAFAAFLFIDHTPKANLMLF